MTAQQSPNYSKIAANISFETRLCAPVLFP
jgi:hypothetical protein